MKEEKKADIPKKTPKKSIKEIKKEKTVNKKDITLPEKIKRLIVIIVILISVLLISIVIYNNFRYSKYVKYESKMQIYGFSGIYDNGNVNTPEKVTKLEALKMVISSIYNYSDFTDFYFSKEQEDDQLFLDFMLKKGIIESKDNYDKTVRYIDVLKYFVKGKEVFLGEKITKYDGDLKGISNYGLEEQAVIKDMVANKIIEPSNKRLPLKDKVIKGMLNEIVVNFVERYSTITVGKEKININPEKIPNNHKDYPYTLSSVDKKIYEKENINVDDDYKNAAELFVKLKSEYAYIEEMINKYLQTILNVDYTNFDEAKFRSNIEDISLFSVTDHSFNEYFKYVKDNQIKITGIGKVQFPAIYFDGLVYRVRAAINIKIENAIESENLLFMDTEQLDKVKYEGDSFNAIVDIPISRYYNNLQLAVYVGSLFPSSNDSRAIDNAEEELTGIW